MLSDRVDKGCTSVAVVAVPVHVLLDGTATSWIRDSMYICGTRYTITPPFLLHVSLTHLLRDSLYHPTVFIPQIC